jgi:hypothetical protein
LFSQVLGCRSVADVEALLVADTATYWDSHYRFDVPSIEQRKVMGRTFSIQLIINTLIPIVFHYGKSRQELALQNRALAWLEELGPESNQLMEEWRAYGVTARNAYDSQALIQLRQEYCQERRCLDCAVGNFLLR